MSLLAKMETAAAGRVPLWLDDACYSAALLAGGSPPWSEASEYGAWRRRAQSLLRSDVAMFPLQSASIAWLCSHPQRTAMLRVKRRPLLPLKTLLADVELRAHLTELLGALRGASAELPLVLSCPLPGAFAATVFHAAFGESCEIDEDDADSASVYLADMLRVFGDIGVDGVLLGQTSDVIDAPLDAVCQPIFNLAAHYRWEIGRLQPPHYPVDGLAFVVSAPPTHPAIPTGTVVDAAFWTQATTDAPAAGAFLYAEIPATLAPETVLSRLDVLRR